MTTMEKVGSVKIDSWEPSEEHKFKYPKREKVDLEKEILKAFKEGVKENTKDEDRIIT